MPKIIPDLAARILESAARRFETDGFAATDMKSLAAEVGISVGTLYNYYPSKPELFLEVSVHWKEKLSARMLARIDAPDGPEAKLRDTLLMLYDDMVQYTGIWKEFQRSGAAFKPGTPMGDRFRKDNDELNRGLQLLFQQVWKDHPHAQGLVDDPHGRLAQIMVGSIMQLVMNSGQGPESNREFVLHWIDFVAPR